jgi:hypothetical protein
MALVKTKVLSKAALLGETAAPTSNLDSLYAALMLFKELNPVPTSEQLGYFAKSINAEYGVVLQAFEDLENPQLEMLASADMGEGEGIAESLGLNDNEVDEEGTDVLKATSIGEDENALIEFSGVDDLVNGPYGAPSNDPLNNALKVDAPIETTERHSDQVQVLEEVKEEVKEDTQGEE